MKSKLPVFIPARLNSSRLDKKLLLKIDSKTIIQLVYEQVLKCKNVETITVLTDHLSIFEHLTDLGYNVKMTGDFNNGTERICSVLEDTNYDSIVNVQGDEPFISPELIDILIEKHLNSNYMCTTAHYKIINKRFSR